MPRATTKPAPAVVDVTGDDAQVGALLAGAELPAEPELAADPEPGLNAGDDQAQGIVGKLFGAAAGDKPAKKRAARPRPPTEAIRKDIRAKTALMLGILGTTWEGRDPHCGGEFMEAVPPTSDALADILCDSPDIVVWFTSSGKFMKWLTLLSALQPVGMAVVAHHITHTVDDDGSPPADWSAYAAG